MWTFLENPRPENVLVAETTYNPQITGLLHRGKKFLDLAFHFGLNVASKRARKHYQRTAGSFEGGKDEYFEVMGAHNRVVLGGSRVR